MGKYDGFLICSDIDGTLDDGTGNISRENLEAIEYFQSEGGLFTVATGRFAHYVVKFPFKVNAPVVCVNGSAVYDLKTDCLLELFPLSGDYARAVNHMAANYGDCYESAEICGLDSSQRFEGRAADCADMISLVDKGEALKIVFRFLDETTAANARIALNKEFDGEFDFVRAWNTGLEMLPISGGKGKCVKLLKSRYCPKVHTTVGVGDYENDITLLRDCDIGFAVENALPEVKGYADRFAPPHTESAIADVINQLETGKIKRIEKRKRII